MSNNWTNTKKQNEAIRLMIWAKFIMLYGGSRSGKTAIIIKMMINRALAASGSRQLITRYRFNHCKTAIWYDTFPKVLRLLYPDLVTKVNMNKSDWYIEFPNGSQIWIGGTDDSDRIDKVLGNEYCGIFLNESSEISYDAVTTIMTRLAQVVKIDAKDNPRCGETLSLKMYFDQNPPSTAHWTHILFEDSRDPEDKQVIDTSRHGSLHMNPEDNIENLPDDYIEMLEQMPARKRRRFLQGKYQPDTEGALWTLDMIAQSHIAKFGEPIRRVIGVDPAVKSKKTSDDTGIVIAEKDMERRGRVIGDHTFKGSPNQWAQKVVNLYHTFQCDLVVAEANNGGELVSEIITNIDPSVRIKIVHASKGKFARAEPVSALYEQGMICHSGNVSALEEELMTYTPDTATESPDRLDACVWALTELLVGKPQPLPMMRAA